ncbi:hypothetical protein BDW74DRAFT_28648 [Aspergillus multicolor]|uniref:uncharacterized protein n=1 Tax=Aspergillus multicolor TaxID=41759 RepID=UPI003CCDDE26
MPMPYSSRQLRVLVSVSCPSVLSLAGNIRLNPLSLSVPVPVPDSFRVGGLRLRLLRPAFFLCPFLSPLSYSLTLSTWCSFN